MNTPLIEKKERNSEYCEQSDWLFSNITPLIDLINKKSGKLEMSDVEPFI